MTKPREKTREEVTAEIEDGKKKIRQLENREKVLRQKLSQEAPRTRSHRLIVRGAVFEVVVLFTWLSQDPLKTCAESNKRKAPLMKRG